MWSAACMYVYTRDSEASVEGSKINLTAYWPITEKRLTYACTYIEI